MQHFCGELRGRGRNVQTASGTKTSGLDINLLTLNGKIHISIWHDALMKEDKFDITAKLDSSHWVSIAYGVLTFDRLAFHASNFDSKLGGFQK